MPPHDAVDLRLEIVAARDKDESLSRWTCSRAKRIFDVALVMAIMPLLLPLLGAIAVGVAFTCGTPVLFRQTRSGRYGRSFTILKFRTMTEAPSGQRPAIAAHGAGDITPLGRMLRRMKLDELPQVWNVLRGDMSLVGPRPKVPEQQLERLECRPGLTGSATLAFACEERAFADIPRESLDIFYRQVVLPAKLRLDAQYMAQATILTDLRIILLTASGRWHSAGLTSQTVLPCQISIESRPVSCNPAGSPVNWCVQSDALIQPKCNRSTSQLASWR